MSKMSMESNSLTGTGNIRIGFHRIWEVLRVVHVMSAPCRGLFYTAGAFSILVAIVDAAFMIIAVSVIGDVFGQGEVKLPPVFDLFGNLTKLLIKDQPLLSSLLALGIATVLRQIFVGLSRTMSFWASAIIVTNVRVTLCEMLLRSKFRYLDALDSGKPRQIVAKDAISVISATRATVDFISQGMSILLSGVLLVQFSPTLTAIVVALISLTLPGKYIYSRYLHRFSKRNVDASVSLMGLLNEMLMAIRPIKLQNRQLEFLGRLREKSSEAEIANRQVSVLVVWEPVLIHVMAMILMGVLLLLGRALQLGSIPEIVAYFAMLYRLVPFFSAFNQSFSTLVSLYPGVHLTASFLFMPLDSLEKDNGGRVLSGSIRQIAFDKVDFAYRQDRRALHCVSLRATRGEVVAVVGASGSGKSSLVHLLMNMYQPDAGAILIDDHEISEYELENLRSHIGIVSQDVHLLNASIADIIRGGISELGDDEVLAAANLSQANEFIQALPRGYRSLVGERGQALSGGQRQRLLLAQVLARRPQVLILDEATSALDPHTEAKLLAALKADQAQRITLVITHRLNNLVHADRIYVLQAGQIVEHGSFNDLVLRRGYFWDLLSHQQESAGSVKEFSVTEAVLN